MVLVLAGWVWPFRHAAPPSRSAPGAAERPSLSSSPSIRHALPVGRERRPGSASPRCRRGRGRDLRHVGAIRRRTANRTNPNPRRGRPPGGTASSAAYTGRDARRLPGAPGRRRLPASLAAAGGVKEWRPAASPGNGRAMADGSPRRGIDKLRAHGPADGHAPTRRGPVRRALLRPARLLRREGRRRRRRPGPGDPGAGPPRLGRREARGRPEGVGVRDRPQPPARPRPAVRARRGVHAAGRGRGRHGPGARRPRGAGGGPAWTVCRPSSGRCSRCASFAT